MNLDDKPKLSVKKQIELLKEKGIKFELFGESKAYNFLQNNSYLYKVKAYCNTYKVKDENGKTLPYNDLDFAYLVDLSTIDMHLRRFVIRLTLDLEHVLKTKLIRDFNSSIFDGYDVVKNFLSENNLANNFIEEELKKIKAIRQKGADLHSVSQFILEQYDIDLAIWNFIEVIPFGILIDFVKFFYNEHKNIDFDAIRDGLFNAKCLRNNAAHNNCLLVDLKNNIKSPQMQVVQIIYNARIFKGKSINYIGYQMKNRIINDFITTLFIYDKINRSAGMKTHCYEELYELFMGRLAKNKDYYKNNYTIKHRYIFCLKIIKYLKNG